mmetsp:Transcript_70925/g.117843  ORF Transcript_70925/g.117843 Transcript_70925/m.117843 type:complete len:86 (-) Transcript_70925:785-1042(-)
MLRHETTRPSFKQFLSYYFGDGDSIEPQSIVKSSCWTRAYAYARRNPNTAFTGFVFVVALHMVRYRFDRPRLPDGADGSAAHGRD